MGIDGSGWEWVGSLFSKVQKSYRTHRNARFYKTNCFSLVPTTNVILCSMLLPGPVFISTESISQYLNYVGLLHREMGFPNPLTDNWVLSSVLTGIRRILGTPPMPRLIRIQSRLNLNSSRHASFWAICLTAFFGLFRKSHLLPVSVSAFDPKRQFIRSDFVFKDCLRTVLCIFMCAGAKLFSLVSALY